MGFWDGLLTVPRGSASSWAAFGLVLFLGCSVASRLPAQDEWEEEETAEDRKERLMELIERTLASAEKRVPSVLGDLDPRLASVHDRKVARRLRLSRVSLRFDKTPLEDVLETLRDLSGVSIVLSARAREGLKRDQPEVSIYLKNVSIENLMNLLAAQLKDYRFTVRYGAVLMVRAEEYRPRRMLRIYDVSDIIRSRPDFRAPKLGLSMSEVE